MSVVQGSTLYGGSVSAAAIYEIDQGLGLVWADHLKTEINVDGKPRQLTRAAHGGNPIQANIENPTVGDFAGTPTVTIDGRQLSVSELMVLDSFPVKDFKETFPEYQPTGLNIDLKANPKIQKVVMNRIMEATKTQLNELHSSGDSALAAPSPLRWYDGFIKKFLADADATQVGVAEALTAANILDKVYALRNAVPPRLRTKPGLKIFMSWADFDLYDVARRKDQDTNPSTDVVGQQKLEQSNGSKINVVPMLGIPKDVMFATVADKSDSSNLVQGVWVEKDVDALKMYKITEADQTWRIILRFDVGVEYKTGKDIFYSVGA